MIDENKNLFVLRSGWMALVIRHPLPPPTPKKEKEKRLILLMNNVEHWLVVSCITCVQMINKHIYTHIVLLIIDKRVI